MENVDKAYSRVVAILLAVFLGRVGVHRYYMGYPKQGIVQTCGFIATIIGYILGAIGIAFDWIMLNIIALLCLLYGCTTTIWAVIDLIRIITDKLLPAGGLSYTDFRMIKVEVADTTNDSMEALEKLAKLHAHGILTDDEFQQKKTNILPKI